MGKLPLLFLRPRWLGLVACSGGETRKPPEAPWHPATAMLAKYIINTDGSLTRGQMEAGLRKDFAAADANHTNCLDGDETSKINEERIAADQSTASPLVDFKGTGCIDFDEFANTPRSLFDALDRDSNGVLSAQELHPWAPLPNPNGQNGGDDSEHHHHHGHGGEGGSNSGS